MTISSTTRIAGPFIGSGTASTFPFTFKVFAAADLDVVRLNSSTGVESTLVLNSDYSVTLNGDQNSNPGGSITLLAGALATGFTLVITSDIANLQPTDLTNQGGFYPEVITDSLDRATIQIQQISDIGDRTLKIPITDGTLNMELPTAASRANSFLAFDANGLPTSITAGTSGAPATITRQVFSGTGSQTVFTLASDPGALGNSAQVYIGGVYQQRSTYTIAGTTLTFSAAPVAGTDNIEFVNFLTGNIGTTSADLVTYTPAGSGAVARSAASKFGDVVSVKDFGAVGDGVTDDTAAIQAAITYTRSLPNGRLHFPPNAVSQFYKITAPLVVTGPIELHGSGASATTIIGVGFTAGQYILDIDCNAVDVVEYLQIANLTVRSNNSTPTGIRIKNASYVLMKNVLMYGLQDGLVLEGTRCFSNTFENVSSYNITATTIRFANNFSGGGHFTFSGCTFTGSTGVSVPTTAVVDSLTFLGCNWEQCSGNALLITGTCAGLSVVGCRTEGGDTADFLIAPATATEYVQGISISGSTFNASDSGGINRITLGGGSGKIRGFAITGNVVTHGSDNFSASFVQLNGDGESGVISGNVVRGTGASIVNTQRDGVVVYSNENLSGKLVEYWGTSSWGVVQGSFTPTDASGAGLTLTGTVRYTKIGRVVHWQAAIAYPSTASSSNASFGGFPFAIGGLGGSTEGRAGATVNATSHSSALGLQHGIVNNTSVSIVSLVSSANVTNATISNQNMLCSGTNMM
jgi:hypothetical protein